MSEPSKKLSDPRELLEGYLDHYREEILRTLEGLPEPEVSRVPSGWTPLSMLKHLAYMERRWFVWDFAGEQVEDVGGDRDEDGVFVAAESFEEIKDFYLAQCERSRQVVAGASLSDVASRIGRFQPPKEPPTLGWIMFHVLEEYMRHAGHLDIARELAGS
ncbi:DinB family protein [Nonomuraea sp. NPDC005650]|uniref:DinB family protein n=1 Tax=Nonomuraea sp. NPDC005650 TaxID=3157045 RepID=UPI00339FCEF8